MIERFSKLIALLIIVISTGCNEGTEKNSTYFGGKIINPKSDHVVLYDYKSAIDTFYLNQDNTFLGELTSLKEGLYYFNHGNENQYIYLEPRDSVLIRLNTWDFDESLVFSGKGSTRNNLLIDCFLDSEKEAKMFFSFYDLNPNNFIAKVDSLEKIKLKQFEDFVSANPNESKSFLNILNIALTYPLYGHVENYPIAHKMKMHDDEHEMSYDKFYKHRKRVRFDQDSIMYFNAYRNTFVNHIYNEVYSRGHQMKSDEFAIDLLETIHKEVSNEHFKNALLRQTILSHFYRKSSCQFNEEIFNTYFKYSTNQSDRDLVSKLLRDTERLQIGKRLDDFYITDYNHTNRSIHKLIKYKNSFIYFWNPKYASKEYIASRVNFFSREFPDVNFIGVRIDGYGKKRLPKIDIKEQYYLDDKSIANEFLTSKMPRALIIDKKGLLVNGYASLSSNNTYYQLKELAKK